MPVHHFELIRTSLAYLGVDLPDGVDPHSDEVQTEVALFDRFGLELHWLYFEAEGDSTRALTDEEVHDLGLNVIRARWNPATKNLERVHEEG